MCYNCLDRHIINGKGEQIAFYLEGNNLGQSSTLTYQQLLVSVCKIANYLRSIGVKKGDDVTIYMPMIAELPAAMVSLFQLLQGLAILHFRSIKAAAKDAPTMFQNIACVKTQLVSKLACMLDA